MKHGLVETVWTVIEVTVVVVDRRRVEVVVKV